MYALIMLAIQKHVVVRCDHEADIAKETIAAAVDKLQYILHPASAVNETNDDQMPENMLIPNMRCDADIQHLRR